MNENQNEQAEQNGIWELRLYVAGQTARALTTFENLKNICEEHMKWGYSIEVIDLLKNPQLAKGDQILAVPTRRVIGDLSDRARLISGLDLR